MNFIKLPNNWHNDKKLIDSITMLYEDISTIDPVVAGKVDAAVQVAIHFKHVPANEYNEPLDALLDTMLTDESLGTLGCIYLIRQLTQKKVPISYANCPGFEEFVEEYRELTQAARK